MSLLRVTRAFGSHLNSIFAWVRTRLRFRKRGFRRHPILSLPTLKVAVLVVLLLVVSTPFLAPSYLHPPPHYNALKLRCHGLTPQPGCANPFHEKVFITVSLYDRDGHLASGQWGQSVLELISLLGPENVFLSIYENDSGPSGIAALNQLKNKVRSPHEIVHDNHVSLSDFPTVTMPDGTQRLKRLAYLSEIRNRALRPLDTLKHDGQVFDKILFLNDVAFRPVDAANLLMSTNMGPSGRTQYLSTCSMDFMNPFLLYDLYAQRDAEGYSNGLPIFPFFSNAGKGISRRDVLAQRDAVRVSSCWGGMVAMQARYVQNHNESLPSPTFQKIGNAVIDPAKPARISAPVRFRYEPEIFFDACECCLFLADVTQAARRAGSQERGVYVNPYIRVAYDWDTLGWLPIIQGWERFLSVPQGILSPLLGLPRNNPHRNVQEGEDFTEEVWNYEEHRWELVPRMGRSGLFCGVREMQLIQTGLRKEDKNWDNTNLPGGQALNFPT